MLIYCSHNELLCIVKDIVVNECHKEPIYIIHTTFSYNGTPFRKVRRKVVLDTDLPCLESHFSANQKTILRTVPDDARRHFDLPFTCTV
jgi:hypothetical protein